MMLLCKHSLVNSNDAANEPMVPTINTWCRRWWFPCLNRETWGTRLCRLARREKDLLFVRLRRHTAGSGEGLVRSRVGEKV